VPVTSNTANGNAVATRSVSIIVARALWSFWQRGRTVERAGYIAGAMLLVSGLIHIGILTVSGGSWEGPVSLRKPATFGLSFGLTLLTIVWVVSFRICVRGERSSSGFQSISRSELVLRKRLVGLNEAPLPLMGSEAGTRLHYRTRLASESLETH